jgi:hypothetical protein
MTKRRSTFILKFYMVFFFMPFWPIWRGFAPSFVNYKKGCTRLAAASDKVYQLLAQGRWFSPGTPASSTTKTGRHDIAEILLKVALNSINQNQSILWKGLRNCRKIILSEKVRTIVTNFCEKGYWFRTVKSIKNVGGGLTNDFNRLILI